MYCRDCLIFKGALLDAVESLLLPGGVRYPPAASDGYTQDGDCCAALKFSPLFVEEISGSSMASQPNPARAGFDLPDPDLHRRCATEFAASSWLDTAGN
jgi:hypothetical protein